MIGYKCVACKTKYPADYKRNVCAECGANLDVRYDYGRLRDAAEQNTLFDNSRLDIFRYRKLLPTLNPVFATPLRVGYTPLYYVRHLATAVGLNSVYLKDEGCNPSASLKDRASAVVLARAREVGAKVVATATTGNAGSSLACLAAAAGQDCVVFVPENAPPAKLVQLRAYGARVLAVRGTYDDAFNLCRKTCMANGWFNRNTGLNPFTREGKKTCSFEIWEQLDRKVPNWIIVPSGDGNIISGIWKGWRDLFRIGLIERTPRLVCAQSENSDAITRTVRKQDGYPKSWISVRVESVQADTLADSISVDLPRDGLAATRAVIESRGHAITVADDEIIASVGELASLSGVFAEPAAATSWSVLKKMVNQKLITRDESVVCLITGNGLKDTEGVSASLRELNVVDINEDLS